jgi:hypothetical protein
MNTYIFEVNVVIREDDYNEGEGPILNSWDFTHSLTANSLKEALHKFYDDRLSCPGVNFEDAYSYDEGSKFIYFARTEDKNGCYASESEIERWKKGEIRLYSAIYAVQISEVKPISPNKLKKALE